MVQKCKTQHFFGQLWQRFGELWRIFGKVWKRFDAVWQHKTTKKQRLNAKNKEKYLFNTNFSLFTDD